MLRPINRLNKKAVSEVVAYTLLIIIALGLSVMVYSLLKVYLPKEKLSCEEDINLIVQDAACSYSPGNSQLNLTITNKGLFKADAVYIRLGTESQKIRQQINKNNTYIYGENNMLGLNPGDYFSSQYDVTSIVTSSGKYALEIQPAVVIKRILVGCDKAIITQEIVCNPV